MATRSSELAELRLKRNTLVGVGAALAGASLSGLELLDLGVNNVRDVDVAGFASSRLRPRTLSLRRNPIDGKAFARIIRSPFASALRHLDLRDTEAGTAAQELAELSEPPPLETLDLTGTGCHTDSVRRLMQKNEALVVYMNRHATPSLAEFGDRVRAGD